MSTRGGVNGDGREESVKRTRVEEKSDDGMSSVTANKIDDDRLSKEPRNRDESTVVLKVKFAAVIDQWDEGEVPTLRQAQIDEHLKGFAC